MVMRRNIMAINLRKSIFRSLGRYLAIMAIIALGASIFVGLRMTKADMVATGQRYIQDQKMMDIRLISTYGWTEDQVEDARALDASSDAEGQIYKDLIMRVVGTEAESVFRVYSIPERINVPVLVAGRMPENPNECLADGYQNGEDIIGRTYVLSSGNDEEVFEEMSCKELTVVGIVSTPLYMDMNRGTTTVGNGSIANYLLVPEDTFAVDYFTEIQLTIPGRHQIYSKEYNETLDRVISELETDAERLAWERFDQIRSEAEEAYADGLKEYREGEQEFQEEKRKAEEELEDAEKKLRDGEKDLEAVKYMLIVSRSKIDAGWKELEAGKQQLEESLAPIYEVRDLANAAIDEKEALIGNREQQIANELALVDRGIEEADNALMYADAVLQEEQGMSAAQVQNRITELDGSIDRITLLITEAELTGEGEKAEELRMERVVLQEEKERLQTAYAPYQKLLDGKTELLRQKALLESGELIREITPELIAMERKAVSDAFDLAMGLLGSYFEEIEAAEQQLRSAELQYSQGWNQWHQGQRDLEEGWKEFEKGKREFDREISDAEKKLADGWQELMDAREEIDALEEPKSYVLDRTTNIGYNSLDSASDIVEGVSKVFPAFFLLVAALVCITTMTRMVEEERTQIGTLKALGYSNGAIMSKYLLYAGSSALLGCGMGVLLGSVIFPKILWEAYKIMLYIPGELVLTFDWKLCAMVVGMYTAAMLLVTWYCCYKSLQEVPAELIRPKAPAVGKRLLLEYLPFWNRISFLNKVTIRNIFRYRQRLAMMLVGVGGCTALLLTGFGLRDSIVNIVDFQFSEITTYDMTVYFSEGQDENDQKEFRERFDDRIEKLLFYHQISAELDANDQTREIYFIAADKEVEGFIDFHRGDQKLDYPGVDQMLLSVGVAEAMGVSVGDTVTIRNADMQSMQLAVSGIYDNHVENYAIVAPETIERQWAEEPEFQMAFVKCGAEEGTHELGAEIASMEGVMNVSVSEDLAFMVRNMMGALDLVVVVIVFCAGLLAAIVLYNLTNININERLREIATIKVLGFKAGETAMYIFKENLTLSVMGAAFGLGLGRLLLEFVMSQIKIDMVWFRARLLEPSFVWSIVLTILTAVIVDFIFYFRLEKINMAEALKSVE